MRSPLSLRLVLSVSILSLVGAAQAQKPAVEVLDAHWIALRFSPSYPHGRHTQNPLPGDGLTLPAPEASFIKGQAGQGSENRRSWAEYRVPVPNFAADAGVDEFAFAGDLESHGAVELTLDAAKARPMAAGEEAAKWVPAEFLKGKAFDSGRLAKLLNPAEVTLDLRVTVGAGLQLKGEAVLLLHTREALAEPVGWASKEQSGMAFPHIEPLFDQFLRDTSIVLAPDGVYYMTGTTGGPEMMVVTADLSVWKSPDLWHWSPVKDKPRQSTVVWNIDRDGTWMKPVTMRDGEPFRPLWAPEIHAINGTFWIPFSVPRHGTTLLKSTSGKAEGPYEIAIKPDEPLSTGIDGSLFQDTDGSVYFLNGGGWIAKMKPDMSGLAEPMRHITSASGREVGFEGVSLFKDGDAYNLCVADFVLGEYNTYIATAKSLNGPWSERYLAVPHAGHANFFRDKQGRMWSTFFGNDRHSPFGARPSLVPMVKDAKGRWHPDATFVWPAKDGQTEAKALTQVPGAIGPSDGQPQQVGVMSTKR
ncbi:MAG: family 43 glycosylhydrolase [Acidobacteriaceae bacterium]|nr:family 43 glycosylhydrolase [Acidobacteriaceae bacterium]